MPRPRTTLGNENGRGAAHPRIGVVRTKAELHALSITKEGGKVQSFRCPDRIYNLIVMFCEDKELGWSEGVRRLIKSGLESEGYELVWTSRPPAPQDSPQAPQAPTVDLEDVQEDRTSY